MQVTATVRGIEEVKATLAQWQAGAEVVGRTSIRLVADVGYAPFVEYGTRRMAARPFLRPALAAAEASLRGRLVAALPKGAQPTAAALLGIANDALAVAQRLVPVKTGNLRRSLHTISGGR